MSLRNENQPVKSSNGEWHANGQMDEESWVKSYMDLTGATEAQARSVFMYVGCHEPRESDPMESSWTPALEPTAQSYPK